MYYCYFLGVAPAAGPRYANSEETEMEVRGGSDAWRRGRLSRRGRRARCEGGGATARARRRAACGWLARAGNHGWVLQPGEIRVGPQGSGCAEGLA